MVNRPSGNRAAARDIRTGMSRTLKLTIWAFVLWLLTFLVFIGSNQLSVVDGEVDYDYFDVAALAGGIAVIAIAVALLRRDPESRARPPRWALAVGALLIVLGSFHVVRGLGLLPTITGCTSESDTYGVCTQTGPFTP